MPNKHSCSIYILRFIFLVYNKYFISKETLSNSFYRGYSPILRILSPQKKKKTWTQVGKSHQVSFNIFNLGTKILFRIAKKVIISSHHEAENNTLENYTLHKPLDQHREEERQCSKKSWSLVFFRYFFFVF